MKGTMKKLLAFFLTIVMLLAVTACGGGKDASLGNEDAGGDKVQEESGKNPDKAEDNYTEGDDILSYINKNMSPEYAEYIELRDKADFGAPISYVTMTVGDFQYAVSENEKMARCIAYTGNDENIVFPAEADGYRVIDVILEEALPNHNSIKSITVEEGIMSVQSSMAMAFNNLKSLQTINLPESLVELLYVFNFADSLAEVNFPSKLFMLDGFEKCYSLTSLTIPASVAYIGGFETCRALEEVIFEGNEGLLAVGPNTFLECKNLTSCVLPDSVRILGSGTLSETGLETFHVPAELRDAGYGARGNINRYNRVVEKTPYTDAITEDFLIWNEKYLIAYLGNDTVVTVPEGVTHTTAYAFADNDTIQEINMPESVIYFDGMSITNLTALTKLVINGDVEVFGDMSYALTKSTLPDNFEVHLKKGSVAEDYFIKNELKVNYLQ